MSDLTPAEIGIAAKLKQYFTRQSPESAFAWYRKHQDEAREALLLIRSLAGFDVDVAALTPPAEDPRDAEVKRFTSDVSGDELDKRRAEQSNVEEVKRLREALQNMVDAEVEYMKINNLGDPEKQHNIITARAALEANS